MSTRPQLFDPTSAHAYAGPAATSRRTAERILPRTGSRRRLVLAQLLECGPFYGATDEELGLQLRLNGNTIRPRRIELVEGGWVTDSGRRRPTSSGHDAIVWIPTDAALDAQSAEESNRAR